MRESPPSERETLRLGIEEIRRRLPAGWAVEPAPRTPVAVAEGRTRPDAVARLTGPDGRSADLEIEVKSDGSPRATRLATLRLLGGGRKAVPLLLAPYLPPRSREICEEARVNYADLTGNVRIEVRRPAVFLRDAGATVNPYPGREIQRGLAGAAAARVILWMCRLETPFSPWLLKEAARNSRVSLAYVSRLVRLFEREDLVRRDPRGPIRAMDRPGLVRRWARDYGLLRSNRGRLYLDPRGAKRALDALGTTEFRRRLKGSIAVTGSFAASRYAPVAESSKLVCYVEDVEATARALDLSPAATTGNVFLLSPYDRVVFDTVDEGIPGPDGLLTPMAAPAQIAVDCLTGPDRMPEEGEALLAWLQRNVSGWMGFGREDGP